MDNRGSDCVNMMVIREKKYGEMDCEWRIEAVVG